MNGGRRQISTIVVLRQEPADFFAGQIGKIIIGKKLPN